VWGRVAFTGSVFTSSFKDRQQFKNLLAVTYLIMPKVIFSCELRNCVEKCQTQTKGDSVTWKLSNIFRGDCVFFVIRNFMRCVCVCVFLE
jgi:hypothetical protein